MERRSVTLASPSVCWSFCLTASILFPLNELLVIGCLYAFTVIGLDAVVVSLGRIPSIRTEML